MGFYKMIFHRISVNFLKTFRTFFNSGCTVKLLLTNYSLLSKDIQTFVFNRPASQNCAPNTVSAQRSRIPSRFRILIVGAKPRHSAKPPLGKLRLPKLLVPTQKYCTTTSQEFFPRQTTWKMNMQDEDSLKYEFFILLSTQQHF